MGYTPHVLVIGGGAVGSAIARDLAIRGLEVTVVERESLASGTTGTAPGILSSGAVVAASDPSIAKTCLSENRTLFETARHCIEDTGGLIVTHPGDGVDLDSILAASRDCGIAASELSEAELNELAPSLSGDVERALRIPDASIDPFRITVATARDAAEYGATIHTNATVTDVVVENEAIASVTVRNEPEPPLQGHADVLGREQTDVDTDVDREASQDGSGQSEEEPEDERLKQAAYNHASPGRIRSGGPESSEEEETTLSIEPTVETITPDYVVNATGSDAARVAGLAGLNLPLESVGDPVVVAAGRQTAGVVTAPTGTAIPAQIVPHGPNTVLCPSDGHDIERPSSSQPVQPAKVDEVIDSFARLLPEAHSSRVLRAFVRRRYQVAGHDRPAPHGHDHVIVDHATHGCWGMSTVLGGSLTTHRHVAERVSDHVCKKFGIARVCQTDRLPLPGSVDEPLPGEEPDTATIAEELGLSRTVYEESAARLGSRTSAVLGSGGVNPVLCDCRSVTRAEVEAAFLDETASDVDLDDVRIRTTATMGNCQGGRCAHRLAAVLHPDYDVEVVDLALDHLLAGRWRGQRPATWGSQLQTVARNYWLHAANFDRAGLNFDSPSLDEDEFDYDVQVFDTPTVDGERSGRAPLIDRDGSVPGDEFDGGDPFAHVPDGTDDVPVEQAALPDRTAIRCSLRGELR